MRNFRELECSANTNGNGSVLNLKINDCKDCVAYAEDAKKAVLQGLDG